MSNDLDSLEKRISDLEAVNNDTSVEMEELQFKIINSDLKGIESLSISSSGNFRYWRELTTGGMTKYSNWSVHIKVLDSSNNPSVCDWIKITDCSHRIKQATTVAEKSSISFTTPKTKGWPDISFNVQIKHDGLIYNKVTIKLVG